MGWQPAAEKTSFRFRISIWITYVSICAAVNGAESVRGDLNVMHRWHRFSTVLGLFVLPARGLSVSYDPAQAAMTDSLTVQATISSSAMTRLIRLAGGGLSRWG